MNDRPLEPWGGGVRTPRWVRRLLHRAPEPSDTPEKQAEHHKGSAEPSGPSVLENVDRVLWGGFRDLPK